MKTVYKQSVDRAEVPGWLIAVGVTLVSAAHLLLFYLPEMRKPPGAEVERSDSLAATIVYPGTFADSSVAEAIREQGDLFDTEPLILPTRWNAALPAMERSDGLVRDALLTPFDPRIVLVDIEPPDGLDPGQPVPDLLEMLSLAGNLMPGLLVEGRNPVERLASRTAWVEIGPADGSDVMVRFPVEWSDFPKTPGSLWRPVTFVCHVGNAGEIGAPVRLTGSNEVSLDAYIRDRLMDTEQVRTLESGYYILSVSP